MGESPDPVVLGVDSSTGSTKVEARDIASGELLATGRSSHPHTAPPCSEQDPRSWWAALVDSVAQIGEQLGVAGRSGLSSVVAIAVAGQQHGLVVCDPTGSPLRPAKLWNDTESSRQAETLVRALGERRWATECGSVPVAAFTVTKLAWLVENEPRLLERIAAICLPHDWLTWQLCGALVTDRGDASGTGWFDAAGGTDPLGAIRSDLLAAALAAAPGRFAEPAHWEAMLPRVLAPDAPAGTLTAAAARQLGLPTEVIVAPGTGDNMAAALGLGMVPGDVTFSLGTSGTVYAVSSRRSTDPSGAVAGFADATGEFLPLVCTLNATKVTDTVAGWLGADREEFAQLALSADADSPNRVELVPYFDGERTPDLPDSTGSISGLRNDTTRADIALAAHDGVLGGLISGLDALRAVGVGDDGGVNLVGGGSRSPAYRQRLADLIGRPINVPDEPEVVAAGAALQAAVVHSRHAAVDDHAIPGHSERFAEIAQQWELGAGTTVAPRS